MIQKDFGSGILNQRTKTFLQDHRKFVFEVDLIEFKTPTPDHYDIWSRMNRYK